MKLVQILFVSFLLMMTSCSSKRKKADDTTAETAETQQDADFIVDADEEELIVDDSTNEGSGELNLEEESSGDINTATDAVASTPSIEMSGEMANYTVKKNDTLMMIAFRIYGDYRKWKELKSLNGLSSSRIDTGMVIKYNRPAEEFVWSPEGLPYLIKTGDTLASISNDKYGTESKWRSIYNNNKPLIRDPNLIFAGFTIYYLQDRDLASE
jgi:nucleoid-associated protein YgaU